MEIIQEKDLLDLSHEITAEWKDVARYLNIKNEEIYRIQNDNAGRTQEQIYQMLLFWKRKKGDGATYMVLADALRQAQRNDLVDDLSSGQGIYKRTHCDTTTRLHPSDETCVSELRFLGFRRFILDVASIFTLAIALQLATVYSLPDSDVDRISKHVHHGWMLLEILRQRREITPTDISSLTNALNHIGFHEIVATVEDSFKRNVSVNLCSPTGYMTTKDDTGRSFVGNLNQLQRFLKAAYELLYKAIQPVPYIRDKLFCVNDVFVEGGIEFCNDTDKEESAIAASSSKRRIQNKPLESYRDVFNDDVVPSKRVIVEGEPGYGKSTLTLQAAYDWCEEHSPSFVSQGVELFILLRLRLMKGITSIYTAIKLFILPRDCNLSESEIRCIINSCSSVVIVLDGYDEYPDINSDLKSDFMEIIKGKMFTNFKLILCTRSGCLPSNLDPRTVRVRLTGFNADARDKYVRMAVVGDSSERAKDIRQNLERNPILCDLCQVPLFFVMFAHMAHESTDIYKCNSVTSFFKYMIYCFYRHTWNKEKEMGAVSRLDTAEKRRLYKLAFEGLTGKEQNIVWEKTQFCRKVGTECFEELIRIGILVEETILEINITTKVSVSEYIQEKIIVRFYHKLFAEWYAAHYAAKHASSFLAFFLLRTLKRVNPNDLQFVFRFACGLDPSCAKRIVTYLRKFHGGESFATLCILEQAAGTDDVLDTVRDMCSRRIEFSCKDSQILNRSRLHLFDVAAKNQIPVSKVFLGGCFQSVDLKEECLCLFSGLQLSRLDTLKELSIFGKHDLRDRAGDVLDYSARCAALETLRFVLALLPHSFDDKDVLAKIHRKKCKVQWLCFSHLSSLNWELNLQSGKWEQNGKEMTDEEYRRAAQKCGVNICDNTLEDGEDNIT